MSSYYSVPIIVFSAIVQIFLSVIYYYQFLKRSVLKYFIMKVYTPFLLVLNLNFIKCKDNDRFIPKCCAEDEVFFQHSCIHSNNISIKSIFWELTENKLPFKPNRKCEQAVVVEQYHFDVNGTVHLDDTNDILSTEEYCMEIESESKNGRKYKMLALMCYSSQDVREEPDQTAMCTGNCKKIA